MTKRLRELIGEKESLHKGLFSRGYNKLYNFVDKTLPHGRPGILSQRDYEEPKKTPNLGQIDAKKDKEPNFSVGKAVAGAVVGGLVTGSPIGAASLGFLWGTQKKKKK